MNYAKSILLIFIFFSTAKATCQTNYFTSLSSFGRDGYKCGGTKIIGKIYGVEKNKSIQNDYVPVSDTLYTLKISSSDKIVFSQVSSRYSKGPKGERLAEFNIPNQFQIGQVYSFQLSTSKITTSPVNEIFGINKLPYSAKLLNLDMRNNKIDLGYQIKIKDSLINKPENIYKITLNNDKSYEFAFHKYFSSIALDSVKNLSIRRIVNTCGYEGIGEGEIKINNSKSKDYLYITTIGSSICKNGEYAIKLIKNYDVDTTSLKLYLNSYIRNEPIPYKLDGDFIKFKISDRSILFNVNYISLKDNIKNLTSNFINPSYQNQIQRSELSIEAFSDKNLLRIYPSRNDNYSEIYKLEVNSIDAIKNKLLVFDENNHQFLSLPLPKNDTIFTFANISDACGDYKFSQTYQFKKSNLLEDISKIVKKENLDIPLTLESGEVSKYYTNSFGFCNTKISKFSYKFPNSFKNDSVVFQLSKDGINFKTYSSIANIDSICLIKFPDTLVGNFKFRFYCKNRNLSSITYPLRIITIPKLKITNSENFVKSDQIPFSTIKIESNLANCLKYDILLANNEIYSYIDFNNYFKDVGKNSLHDGYNYDNPDVVRETVNEGIRINHNDIEKYTIKYAYNQCGTGEFSGNPDISATTPNSNLNVFEIGNPEEFPLLNEKEINFSMNVFPNPTFEEINLKVENANENIKVEIVNNLGLTSFIGNYKFDTQNESIKISLKNYATGVYILKVSNAKFSKSYKILKN